jgi:hypothetical protein
MIGRVVVNRALSISLLAWGAALLAGCASDPVNPAALHDPALRAIHAELVRVVERAAHDPRYRWVSGWDGNDQVKESPATVRGLCWEWQELVYAEVAPTVHRVGWDLVRININKDVFSEHNAVAVFDPARTRRADLLAQEDPEAWVLDPWTRGAADVYRLADWLDLPWIVFAPAQLEIPAPRRP